VRAAEEVVVHSRRGRPIKILHACSFHPAAVLIVPGGRQRRDVPAHLRANGRPIATWRSGAAYALRVRTPLSLDRFLTFIDAIVAIAVTLLILPLVELTSDLDPDKTSFTQAVLSEEAVYKYASFAVSFAVIFRLWRVHHRLMEPIEVYDRVVLVVTMAWAFTVVVLPFPTALISVYGKEVWPTGFYLVTLFLSSACLSVLAVYLTTKRELHKQDLDPSAEMAVASVATSVLLGLGAVLGVLVPRVNYGGLLLLLLTGVLSKLIDRWRTRRAG
jgi:uncharacterized membrane protein